jgi:6-phosphogluconate dehydrogenase
MKAASKEHGWNLDLSECARIWLGGCIIRSVLLKPFMDMTSTDKARQRTGYQYILDNIEGEKQVDWRLFQELASSRGIAVPSMSASLSYFDSLRRDRLPQIMIQAQRDFFGAHTYERIDKKGTFHTDWE